MTKRNDYWLEKLRKKNEKFLNPQIISRIKINEFSIRTPIHACAKKTYLYAVFSGI